MVLQTRSSGSFQEIRTSGSDEEEPWTSYDEEKYQVSEYPSSDYPSDSYLSSREATFSEGTRSTLYDEGSSVYSDEYSQVSAPAKKQEPTTVIVLQYHISQIDKIDEARELPTGTGEEKKTEKAEPVESKRQARSFSRFRKHFGRKKMKALHDSSRVPPLSKEAESPSSLRRKGLMLLPRKGSKPKLQEEQTSSVSQLDAVSSNDSSKGDQDESTDGGSLNTYDSKLMNARNESTIEESTREGSTVDDAVKSDRHAKSVVVKARHDSGQTSNVVPTMDDVHYRAQDEYSSIAQTANDDKSVKSTKSNQSVKSNRSNISIRSLSGIFKRKRSGKQDYESKSAKSAPGESEEGRKTKKKRSWIPIRRRRSRKKTASPTKKPVRRAYCNCIQF